MTRGNKKERIIGFIFFHVSTTVDACRFLLLMLTLPSTYFLVVVVVIGVRYIGELEAPRWQSQSRVFLSLTCFYLDYGGDDSFCLLMLVLPSVFLLIASNGLGRTMKDNKELGGTKEEPI